MIVFQACWGTPTSLHFWKIHSWTLKTLKTLKKVRPVANLKFLSKPIERDAILEVQSYLSINNLNATMQSAYRQNHSLETVPYFVCVIICFYHKTKDKKLFYCYSITLLLLILCSHDTLFQRAGAHWTSFIHTNNQLLSVLCHRRWSASAPLKQGVPRGWSRALLSSQCTPHKVLWFVMPSMQTTVTTLKSTLLCTRTIICLSFLDKNLVYIKFSCGHQ